MSSCARVSYDLCARTRTHTQLRGIPLICQLLNRFWFHKDSAYIIRPYYYKTLISTV